MPTACELPAGAELASENAVLRTMCTTSDLADAEDACPQSPHAHRAACWRLPVQCNKNGSASSARPQQTLRFCSARSLSKVELRAGSAGCTGRPHSCQLRQLGRQHVVRALLRKLRVQAGSAGCMGRSDHCQLSQLGRQQSAQSSAEGPSRARRLCWLHGQTA